jgi:uncharacterized protein (TIGR02118 family)
MPAKVLVLYPQPDDRDAFDDAYRDEHTPMVTPDAIPGMTKLVVGTIQDTPEGPAPFYKMAELHFDSLADLQAGMSAESVGPVLQHAGEISTGGPPVALICDEDDVVTF